ELIGARARLLGGQQLLFELRHLRGLPLTLLHEVFELALQLLGALGLELGQLALERRDSLLAVRLREGPGRLGGALERLELPTAPRNPGGKPLGARSPLLRAQRDTLARGARVVYATGQRVM